MSKFENIVVGIDISKFSIEVLKRAFLLAKEKDAKLTVVHAIDPNWFESFFSTVDEKDTKGKIKSKIIEKIKKANINSVDYSIIVKKKDPEKLVVDSAKKLKADLIVVGANTKNDSKNKVFGSTTRKISQNSRLPILIVKNSFKKEYSNILAFTDLSKTSEKGIKFAQKFFPNIELKAVYAYKQLNEFMLTFYDSIDKKDKIQDTIVKKAKKEFEAFKKKNNITKGKLVESYFGVDEVLYKTSLKEKCDLAVLGSTGVNNVDSFLIGSTSASLMERLDSDVLVYVP